MRRAFTLIELLVVLTIVAMVLAVVSVSLKETYQGARLQEAAEFVQLVDRQLREQARNRHQTTELVIDLDRDRLEVVDAVVDDGPRRTHSFGSVDLNQVWLAGQRAEVGRVSITYSPYGQSRTFALRMQSKSDAEKFVLITGVTGQASIVAQADEVESAIQLVQTMSNAR